MKSALSALFHFLIFFATFSLEVTVHAGESKIPPVGLVQEPALCANRVGVCAIENMTNRGYQMSLEGESSVVLDVGAAIVRKSSTEIRLLKGTIWVKAESATRVTTEFGEIANQKAGEFWVSRTKDQMTGAATTSVIDLRPKGSKETLEVYPGLQNTIGAIGFDGKSATGIPMPIPFKDHLIRWARLFNGPKKDFEENVESFHQAWSAASVASAEINQSLYERKVSSVETAKAERAAKAQKAAAENHRLRELFRQRALGEP